MATVAQIHANRKNAKESSGPKTAAGKSAASANAKRHGLRSSRILLDDEDPAEFETLISELHARATRWSTPNPTLTGRPTGVYPAGLMFWFIRNRFVGSYFVFRATRRSYFAGG